jgi:hypothetical protein
MSISAYGVVANASYYGGLSMKQGPGVIDARVKATIDYYNTTGSEIANWTVAMGPPLPLGANIVDVRVSVSANLTAGVLVYAGDLVNGSRYISAAPATAAAGYGLFTATYGVPNSQQYIIGTTDTNTSYTDRQITVTLGNATNNSQSGTIVKCTVLYTLD